MKIYRHAILTLICLGFISCAKKEITPNTNESFDFDWKFYAQDISNSEQVDFNDNEWRSVDLPHDWSIEGNFSKNHASFSRGGWLPTGKVTYRKTFEVDINNKGKRHIIYFDGAYRNSEVYINGHLLGKRPLGYIAFFYDMTDYIKFKEKNVITVKLDNSAQPGSRWYSGTGIYRHVKLITTNKLYIPQWQNYIKTNKVSDNVATIDINTKIVNEFENTQDFNFIVSILDHNNKIVHQQKSNYSLLANSSKDFNTEIQLSNPHLWNIEDPYLYTIKTQISQKENIIHEENSKTGIRSLDFNNINGFKLNGNPIKIKGVCLHHAGGPLGAAVYKRTIQRQLEKLKEMGANAVRTAHNPFSEEFLDACDEMGFLVMNEMFDEWEVVKKPATTQNGKKIRIPVKFYADIFKDWADKDLTDFVLRDRNHPSVIMWSIGNEIDQMREPRGAEIGKRLADIVHKLDYRPVTNGVNGYGWGRWPNEAAVATSDIYGYNYIEDEGLTKEREHLPNVKAIITEHASAQSFYPRGTYLFKETEKEWWNKLNYDNKEAYEWVQKREPIALSGMDAWRSVKKREHIMGMFIWTGWDYLGEVIPFGWPARSSSFAPIDIAGFPKDGYYFYQSQWSNKPMVHIFPHWNLKGMEGKKVTIYSYTNGDEVELFQDGKSLGKQKNDTDDVQYQSWDLTYQPGQIKAISYKNGQVISEKIVNTAGKPHSIEVETRRDTMNANAQDVIYVECSIKDANGNLVPTANNLLEFEVSGPSTIAGVANGNNMGLEPFKSNKRTAFNGKCLVILKSTKEAGTIDLIVKSTGLISSKIQLRSK